MPVLQRRKAVMVNKLVIHLEHFHKTEPLECIAVNTVSGKSDSATKTLSVTGKGCFTYTLCFSENVKLSFSDSSSDIEIMHVNCLGKISSNVLSIDSFSLTVKSGRQWYSGREVV